MNARRIIELITWANHKDRPPYSLSLLELVLAAVVDIVIWNALAGREPSSLVDFIRWPLLIVQSIAMISLVRFARNDVRSFSRLSHLMLAWPLLTLSTLLFSEPLSFFVFLMGLPVGLGVIIFMLISRQMRSGEWVAVLVNGIWLYCLYRLVVLALD